MKNLIVFMAVLTIALLGSAGIANAGTWDGTTTTMDNVGIGTENPGYKLQINGNTDALGIVGTSATLLIANSGGTSFFSATGALRFFANNIEAIRIVSDGNVGIGTDNPGSARLAVMNGNVGIGTTEPATKLHVNGDVTVSGGGITLDNNWSLGGKNSNGDVIPFIRMSYTDKLTLRDASNIDRVTIDSAGIDVSGDIIADNVYVDVDLDGDGIVETSVSLRAIAELILAEPNWAGSYDGPRRNDTAPNNP